MIYSILCTQCTVYYGNTGHCTFIFQLALLVTGNSEPVTPGDADQPAGRPAAAAGTREKRKKGADKKDKRERCSCNKVLYIIQYSIAELLPNEPYTADIKEIF